TSRTELGPRSQRTRRISSSACVGRGSEGCFDRFKGASRKERCEREAFFYDDYRRVNEKHRRSTNAAPGRDERDRADQTCSERFCRVPQGTRFHATSHVSRRSTNPVM